MDKLIDLIMSPTYATKPTNSSQDDNSQNNAKKNLYRQTQNTYSPVNLVSESKDDEVENKSQQVWTEEERRKGDRRQEDVQRGRWLDSRNERDRRKALTDICVKI